MLRSRSLWQRVVQGGEDVGVPPAMPRESTRCPQRRHGRVCAGLRRRRAASLEDAAGSSLFSSDAAIAIGDFVGDGSQRCVSELVELVDQDGQQGVIDREGWHTGGWCAPHTAAAGGRDRSR